MTRPVDPEILTSLRDANKSKDVRLRSLLEAPGVEVLMGGSGIPGDLHRIYQVRHEIAKHFGRDSPDWPRFVAVLRERQSGPSIRLVTVSAGDRGLLAVLDGESFEVLAELGPGET